MTSSLDLQQKSNQNQQQIQRLIMSPAMQQAVHLMQLPALELGEFIENSLEQNPVMERIEEDEDNSPDEAEIEPFAEQELTFDENDFSVMQQLEEDFRDYFEEENGQRTARTMADDRLQTFLEQSIRSQPTLFEHLTEQSDAIFSNPKERALAAAIIGNLDEFGYLHIPLSEIAALQHVSEKKLSDILKVIQTFEPYGVAASSLQECLLIQLRCWGLHNTLAAKIIEHHFDDLLHNRIPAIQKGLGCSAKQVTEEMHHHLARLDLRPGACFLQRTAQAIVPDATVHVEGDGYRIEINNDFVPSMRINHRYMRMAADATVGHETKQFIHHHVTSAKWLLRNIQQRNDTLERIVKALSEKQSQFFNSEDGQIAPLTMGVIATELGMHESTVARAVANKYVQTPRGLLALRSFFSNAYTTQEGKEISSSAVREVLQELIDKEDKKHPLSDASLADLLKEKGIPCARRTVAKYRGELNLGNAQQRKRF